VDVSPLGGTDKFGSFYCQLRDSQGRVPAEAEGLGKGSIAEARVGAVYEALEHLLAGPGGFTAESFTVRPVEEALIGPIAEDVAAGPLASLRGSEVAGLLYETLHSGTNTTPLWVPAALVCPWYVERPAAQFRAELGDGADYSSLMRYTTNSGTAIGASRTEALLHALNEVIERDALSLFLVRTYLLRDSQPLPLVDTATLPARIREVLEFVSQVRGAKARLLDITSDMGVPAYLAYVPGQEHSDHRRGVGCSTSPMYAAWRAVTELVQTLLFHPQDEPGTVLKPLAKYPRVYAAGRMRLDELPSWESAGREFRGRARSAADGSTGNQVEHLVSRMALIGLPAFVRFTRLFGNGVESAHVFVPGAERFMLTVGGSLVVPGKRAVKSCTGRS
jgi:ribosomal protein S12 methylthiotransferase accessory factor